MFNLTVWESGKIIQYSVQRDKIADFWFSRKSASSSYRFQYSGLLFHFLLCVSVLPPPLFFCVCWLMCKSVSNFRDVVLKLLQFEASTNVADSKGCFPLHLAAWRGDVDIVRILVHHGPSHCRVNQQVNTAVYPILPLSLKVWTWLELNFIVFFWSPTCD